MLLSPQSRARLKATLSVLLILVPLIFLGLDYRHTPVLLSGCIPAHDKITPRELVKHEYGTQGTYKGHHVYLSLDDIYGQQYLSYVKHRPIALVIAMNHEYKDAKGKNDPMGPMTTKIWETLSRLSPQDGRELGDIARGSEPALGWMKPFPLSLKNADAFPVSYLYIVGVRFLSPIDDGPKRQLEHALKEVIAQAGRDGIASLIVPNVAVPENDPSLADLHEILFTEASPIGRPPEIYLSVFDKWNKQLAIDAVESAWQDACDALPPSEPYLVEEEPRLIAASLFVCLFVCAWFVPMTVKNWFIITIFFIGMGVGALAVTGLLKDYYSAEARTGIQAIVLLVLALLFPVLSKWNPSNVFDSKVDNA